jgi:hypothetical protein
VTVKLAQLILAKEGPLLNKVVQSRNCILGTCDVLLELLLDLFMHSYYLRGRSIIERRLLLGQRAFHNLIVVLVEGLVKLVQIDLGRAIDVNEVAVQDEVLALCQQND